MEFGFVEERGGVTSISNECSTLVLPALSIGNVGQLAIDLLISSTRAKKIAFLDEPSMLPCVGNDAYGPLPTGDVALPMEAYESTQFLLPLIQQRSPVLKDNEIREKKKACYEDIENGLWGWRCRSSVIDKENCALRCLSPACYSLIYESDPLEEGKKDFVRGQEYKYCMHRLSLGESLDGVKGAFDY